uniref:Uncharacterized protein n=1 Tax=Zea mays TaxID=4577 RepID=C4J755_MAIZE|nr:unknown [Zea mays]ACR37420.1 unknown [Zea mays]
MCSYVPKATTKVEVVSEMRRELSC